MLLSAVNGAINGAAAAAAAAIAAVCYSMAVPFSSGWGNGLAALCTKAGVVPPCGSDNACMCMHFCVYIQNRRAGPESMVDHLANCRGYISQKYAS